MRQLLAFAKVIDWINDRFGWIAEWAVFLSCFISAGNAIVRYLLDISSNGLLEIQWYLFAVCVMLGASQVLRVNEHVRVDIFYARLTGHGKVYVDLFGLIFFLLPVMGLMAYLSWPLFMSMYRSGEVSGNAGGLIRWPIKFVIPAGFVMLALQGISEVIKRIAALQGYVTIDAKYERPTQ